MQTVKGHMAGSEGRRPMEKRVRVKKAVGTFDPDSHSMVDKVFRAIVAYKQGHDGNSPTLRELMTDCGISSTSVAFYYLNKLADLGKIRRPEPEIGNRSSANIEVVGGKWEFELHGQ